MAVKKSAKSGKSKQIVEKATGETYSSKAAMARHEKGESKKMQAAERKGKKGK